jgi:hypothetical protein
MTVLADANSQAGPLGLLIIVLLGIAVVFLGRSMSKHLRRVPSSFDASDAPDSPAPKSEEPPAGIQ